jgi:hypothetical protein
VVFRASIRFKSARRRITWCPHLSINLPIIMVDSNLNTKPLVITPLTSLNMVGASWCIINLQTHPVTKTMSKECSSSLHMPKPTHPLHLLPLQFRYLSPRHHRNRPYPHKQALSKVATTSSTHKTTNIDKVHRAHRTLNNRVSTRQLQLVHNHIYQ